MTTTGAENFRLLGLRPHDGVKNCARRRGTETSKTCVGAPSAPKKDPIYRDSLGPMPARAGAKCLRDAGGDSLSCCLSCCRRGTPRPWRASHRSFAPVKPLVCISLTFFHRCGRAARPRDTPVASPAQERPDPASIGKGCERNRIRARPRSGGSRGSRVIDNRSSDRPAPAAAKSATAPLATQGGAEALVERGSTSTNEAGSGEKSTARVAKRPAS